MNKLLSQDEVDALLKGLDAGDIETEQDTEEPDEEFETFDWTAQGKQIKTRFPLLEVVHGRFCQKFRGTLSSALRKMVDVTNNPIGTIRYSDFQRSLPVPTSMHLFKMEPLRGTGILVIESRLVFALIEAFFGGSGTGSTKIEGRDFTPIEKRMIEKVVQMALVNLTESWEDVYPIKTEFIRSESNPLVVNVVPGEELLILAKFEVELNKPLGNITMCVPVSTFQPIRQKLSGGYRDEDYKVDSEWLNTLREQVEETEVELSVFLGRTELAVRDLINMREGDIIILDNEFRKPLMATVEGVPKFNGYAGRWKNRKVFKVEHPILWEPRESVVWPEEAKRE
ncbi:MAG: flagellar motor switch protein FliM [Deltaproteobacteria bacterium]|nr:flagellar motor switch protein FliM [Deltaproteobacteria bacterium]